MTLIARMSFLFCAVGLSASAQTGLPIPNGTYAVDSSLCEATGFTEFQQGRPSVIEVEGTAYFYNEAACEMQNLRVFGDDIIFDANCSTEGEASLARDIWVRTGAESFRAGVLEYHRCRAADAANATSQDGQLAVTDGDSVYSLQISLLRLGYDPGPADGQIGQRTISALNMFQRSVGMAVTPYITLEAAKRATEEEAKRFGWDIDSAGGNAEIETQDLFENDVAADQANEQAGVQGEAQPGALPDDLPQTLRFAISPPPHPVTTFSAPPCQGENAIITMKETDGSGATPNSWILSEACLNEEARQFIVMGDVYDGLLLNTADAACINYAREGQARGAFSVSYCNYSGLVSDVREADVAMVNGMISSPMTRITASSPPYFSFLEGVVKGDRALNGRNVDGTYQVDISAMPALAFAGQEPVDMTVALYDMSNGQMTVENGVGRMVLDNLGTEWPHALYLKVDFNTPQNSFYRAIFRNGMIEGYRPNDWVERRKEARDLRFLFGDNRIGIVGIGQFDVDAYGGASDAGMFQLSIGATKISD